MTSAAHICSSSITELAGVLPDPHRACAIFATHAGEILAELSAHRSRLAELGAGTAAKTGILLRAALRFQPEVLYQPIDVSASALREAAETLGAEIPGVVVVPQVANYINESFTIGRPAEPPRPRALHRLQHRKFSSRRTGSHPAQIA